MKLKITPINEVHKSLGARMVPFAGWEMPVQYSGVIEEHLAVRSACGLFDVSHMGEIEVSGPNAFAYAQRIMTNDISRAVDGQCQYTLLCYEDGGVVDDCIVYRYSPDRLLFVVNASNTDKVFEWMTSQNREGALIENLSGEFAQLALQGPNSVEVMDKLLDIDPDEIKHFHFHMGELDGSIEAIVSRTGYTGEDGFEIYLAPGDAVAAWNMIMEVGREYGIKPVGLGARDTLRLEMGYPLYGHELSEKLTPIEAGLKKYVKFNRDFIGSPVLKKQAEAGVSKSLAGFKTVEAGIPRADYAVQSEGRPIGWVTSGTSSPSLKQGIGMAFVEPSFAAPGSSFEIIIRNRPVKAEVTTLPFYRK